MHQHAERTRILRRDGFTFKQFFVAHDRCAMKVGTDGVLLGAWAPLEQTGSVLDIGCGSGLIALMLAQRSSSHVVIDAVELDDEAGAQARENALASPWAARVNVHTADIVTFAAARAVRYALIVSNPPYFPSGQDCRTPQREQARHTKTLTHEALLRCTGQLLAPGGRFCVVLPGQIGADFIFLAQRNGWHIRQKVAVTERIGREPHRMLLALSRESGGYQEQTLPLRDEAQNYSTGFRALTQDFYLFM